MSCSYDGRLPKSLKEGGGGNYPPPHTHMGPTALTAIGSIEEGNGYDKGKQNEGHY